jgi:hypothetical protein
VVERLGVKIRERHQRMTTARVVHRGVKAAELPHRSLNEARDRGSIADVRGDDERPTTPSFDGFGDPNERLLVACGEHDRRSPIGEHLCDGRTDPATRPRDDRDLAGERATVPVCSLRIFSVHVLPLR